jgi:hypothetical protein
MAQSEQEIEEAMRSVERAYQNRGYIERLYTDPSEMLIARDDDNRIQGTMGIILRRAEEPLPTEGFYNFSVAELPIVPTATKWESFEIGRLHSQGSQSRQIFAGMIVAVVRYAQQHRYTVAIASVKPGLHRDIRLLNIPVYVIPREFIRENIGPEFKGFFLSPPKPIAVYFSIGDIGRYLIQLARTALSAGISIVV